MEDIYQDLLRVFRQIWVDFRDFLMIFVILCVIYVFLVDIVFFIFNFVICRDGL